MNGTNYLMIILMPAVRIKKIYLQLMVGYTQMTNCWVLKKAMASLSTCLRLCMEILLNLVKDNEKDINKRETRAMLH